MQTHGRAGARIVSRIVYRYVIIYVEAESKGRNRERLSSLLAQTDHSYIIRLYFEFHINMHHIGVLLLFLFVSTQVVIKYIFLYTLPQILGQTNISGWLSVPDISVVIICEIAVSAFQMLLES